MAAPVDAGRATYDGSTSTTSHAVTMPGSIGAGDILISIVRVPSNRTITPPSGFEEMAQSSPDTADDVTAVFLKTADGTEGATLTFTLSSADRLAALTYRITGATNAFISSSAIGTTGQPDSASLTIPATRDVLWLSVGGSQGSVTLTSGPSGYANATLISNTGGNGTTTTAAVYGASKQATSVTTENPGAWTLGGTQASNVTYTIAVYTGAMPARVSQDPVEVLVSPSEQSQRLSQMPVEVLVSPSGQSQRLSQMPVEVVLESAASPARLSQMVVEVVVGVVVVTASPFQAYIID